MPSRAEDQIAIIGIGCRLPGAVNNTQDLWDLLERGQNTWTEVPADRFNETAFHHPDASNSGTHNHRGGHFLTQKIDEFDAQFFNIPAIEAKAIDPQQRLLLETTYEALENGGQTWAAIRGSNTSVYVATFTSDYDRNAYKDPDSLPKYHLTGNGQAIISNRLSYIFDLHGTSMTLDTGCSGSIVALHQACQSLRTTESNMAIVGAVNLILSPDHMISMSNLHMLNSDGKSYSFDARGAGYGRGEGIATILLKRLSDALDNGDPIRAVIRATAINQDGRTAGLTKPSSQAQADLHRSVFANSDLCPQDIGYVEAHGTGTVAGDLAEIEAISEVYQTNAEHPLYVGSIKSNLGHLEATSGLAGMIKAILILENKLIPPNADFGDPKPSLEFAKQGIIVQKESVVWSKAGTAKISVNSFGYGGTNGVVILEQAPSSVEGILNESDRPNPPYLFVLSANSCSSVKAMLKQLGDWASTHKDYFACLSHTLISRRSLLSWRISLVASTHQELLAKLADNSGVPSLSKPADNVKIGFVFTGQGAQWYAMGRELFLHCRQYHSSIRISDAILSELGATWTLSEELQREESESRINDSAIAQPAVTALQIALVDLLQEIGIRPRIVIGHSSGEIGAGYAAGILSQRAAIEIAYHRGVISSTYKQQMSPRKGAMIVTEISEADSLQFISHIKQGQVDIACTNSPTNTTISGDEASIEELQQLLDASSVRYRRLPIDVAYHSDRMKTVSEQYRKLLNRFGRRLRDDLERGYPSRNIKYISSVTANEKIADFGPAYWVENLISKVRFYEAVERYCDASLGEGNQPVESDAHNIMIEIGPLGVFSRIIQQTTQSLTKAFDYTYITTLRRGIDAVRSMLELAGKLFELGAPVDLLATEDLLVPKQERTLLHDLPTYPWDHSASYWSESRESKEYRFRKDAKHDLLGSWIPNSTMLEPRWKHSVGIDALPWLSEHRIGDAIVFPGAAYLCMAIEAARQLHKDLPVGSDHSFVLTNIKFMKQLIIPPSPETIELQLSLTHPLHSANLDGSLEWEFRVTAAAADNTWHLHCTGTMSIENTRIFDLEEEELMAHTKSLSKPAVLKLIQKEHETWESKQLYTKLSSHNNAYGASFAAVTCYHQFLDAHQISADIQVPDIGSMMPAKQMQPHLIHPTTLDAIMHSSVPLYIATKGSGPIMPVSMKELYISSGFTCSPGNYLLASSMLTSDGPRSATFETVTFSNDQGSSSQPLAVISAMELRGLGDEISASKNIRQSSLASWKLCWKAQSGFSPRAVQANDFASPARKAVFIGTFQDIMGYASGLYHSLMPLLQDDGFSTHVTSWELDHTDERAIYIVLDFDQQPLLLTQSEPKFKAITKLVRGEAKVFWISAPGPWAIEIEPERSLITGFARTAHAENEQLNLTLFHVKQPRDFQSSKMVKTLAQAIRAAFDIATEEHLHREREYSYRDGGLLVPRLVKGPVLPPLTYQVPTPQSNGEKCDQDTDCSIRLETMLQPNASYVVAGGLGDLGQRLSKLMVDRGARHIVALSRRTGVEDVERHINQELGTVAAEASFRAITCDIADESQVAALVKKMNDERLPPVKGVIQAAVVLHDRTLGNMTLEDFQVPLATKLHGTQNLHNAFSGSHLDFFVTLSSAIGIIGTGGQANYAAGNTFQDAFVDSQPKSHTHHMSVDIGTVADAQANTEVRNNNLRRAGLIPIENEDLLRALDYLMSTEARDSNCRQIAIGFDGNSLLRTRGTNATAQSAMFSEVFNDVNAELATDDTTQVSPSLEADYESTSETTFQQHTRIVRSITRKLSSLIISGDGEISTNKSLLELGLDSLLAIDLKNWITNEFHVNLSAPEILGQNNITTLAERIISHLQPTNEAPSPGTPPSRNGNNASAVTSAEVASLVKPAAMSKASKLPEPPLPDLEATLKIFLSSRESFLSPEEYETTSEKIRDFLKTGSKGQELQRRLQARLEDPSLENWQSDLYAKEIYLQRRDAIHPFYTFYCGHTIDAPSHTQAQRAAIIATTAFAFKQELASGTLEPDQLNGERLCIGSLQWLFNATREPGLGLDYMRRYPENDYVVVLKKVELFQIRLRQDGRNTSLQELEAIFGVIIARPQLFEDNSVYSSPAALTSDKRNSWARSRLELQRIRYNAACIETIEKAAFIMCLDKESPEDPSQRINQFFLGDPQLRWSDKTLQFVVCPNGTSAMICEHTRLDGMSVRSFNRRMTDAIRAYQPTKDATRAPPGTTSIVNNPLVSVVSFLPPDRMTKHRKNLSGPFNHNLKQKYELIHSTIPSLGSSYLHTHKLPVKSAYQIILQLAFRLYYGHNPPSWETISVAHFRGGRIDWIQAVTPPVLRFCTAAAAAANVFSAVPRVHISQRLSLFREAVVSHANLAMRISQGHGFKAHLHCLHAALREGEEEPELFKTQTWLDTRVQAPKQIKTDCLEGTLMQETAFYLKGEDDIFVHYEVEETQGRYFVQTWPGKAERFVGCFERAAGVVRELLEGGGKWVVRD